MVKKEYSRDKVLQLAQDITTIMRIIERDLEKVVNKENKIASQRLRTNMVKLQKLMKSFREVSLKIREEKL